MTTEGTYPYAVGGVSSWCDLVIGGLPEFDWQILPIMAGDRRLSAIFELPAHAKLAGQIELWSEQLPRRRFTVALRARRRESLPANLMRALIGWEGSYEDLLDALLWCRRRPDAVRAPSGDRAPGGPFSVRWRRSWPSTIRTPARPPSWMPSRPRGSIRRSTGSRAPPGSPRPQTDLLHVTAAGWAVIPALVHKQLHGTDMLLTEHGVYVREAYLAAARSPSSRESGSSPAVSLVGLSRAAYAAADYVSPVTEANATWERGLGVDPRKIRVIQNGIERPGDLHRSAGQPEGGLGGKDRSAEGRADDVARRRRGRPPGSRSAALSTGARRRRARRPTRGLVKSWRVSSAPSSISASWGAPKTRTVSCATPTWC